MRVLVTGGYGFIGSHVVERFAKEGYEVFIIDNMSSGKLENVNCKHKFYKFDVEDKRCEFVFKNNNFDIVVHLAAQINVITSLKDPFLDTKTNILGLVNMLELSTKYKVKKFIFASSAAIYGNNENIPLTEREIAEPLSPYGISKYVGEGYCKKWNEIYNLDTICFRFSNVYGPRQGIIGEGGVVSIFMDNITKDQEITLNGDGEQTRDFIYVSDLTDALFKAAESNISSGVYNLSTNSRSSLNNLIKILNNLKNIKGIIKKEDRKGDIKHSSLDNTKIKKALGWIPMVSLEQGIKNTFDWYSTNYKVEESNTEKKKLKYDDKIKKCIPYIENIALFILIIVLTTFKNGEYLENTMDLKLAYIFIIGLTHGRKQTIIATTLTSILVTVENILRGRSVFTLPLDTNFAFKIGMYILVGVIISYIFERYLKKEQSQKRIVESLKDEYDLLQNIYNEILEEKSVLQDQVVNSENSFGKIYGIIKKLDSLESQYVYSEAVEVIEKILKVGDASIYSMDKNNKYLRLIVRKGKNDINMPKTITLDYLKEAKTNIFNGELFVNKNLHRDIPMFISPINDQHGTPIALIMINSVKFERLTLHFINLINVVTGLIKAAILKAYKYEEAIRDKRYIENTPILKREFFENIKNIKKDEMEKNKSEFIMLKVKNKDKDINSLSHLIFKTIRQSDYIGMTSHDDLVLILSNASKSDSGLIVERLNEKGIQAEEYNEEYLYV